MSNLTVRGAIGFAGAALTPFVLLIAPFAAGAIGASFIGLKKRAVMWTGLGFIPPVVAIIVAMFGLQSLTENQSFLQLISMFGLFVVAFAICGGIAAKFAELSQRSILTSLVGFGIGGLIGGFVSLLPHFLMGGEANFGGFGRPIGPVIELSGISIGGAVLGAELGKSTPGDDA